MADLLGIPETLLPVDPAAAALEQGYAAERAARAFPASSLAWATLAEEALDDGRDVEAYAYARTGYHRGLDALRRSGWRGQGSIPWNHEPNRGFLRALAALANSSAAIGDDEEHDRTSEFLRSSSAQAARELGV